MLIFQGVYSLIMCIRLMNVAQASLFLAKKKWTTRASSFNSIHLRSYGFALLQHGLSRHNTHRIHGTGIFTDIWLISKVNVGKYTQIQYTRILWDINGSYLV